MRLCLDFIIKSLHISVLMLSVYVTALPTVDFYANHSSEKCEKS